MTEIIKSEGIKSPEGNPLGDVRQFNMMFKTNIGAIESDENISYLRPETAQGMYVIFARYFGYEVLYTLVFLHREHLAAAKATHVMMVLYKYIGELDFVLPAYLYTVGYAALFKQIHRAVHAHSIDLAVQLLI
jgi:hypothetical protein